MSCSLEGSQIYHILECLVANAIFSRRELGYQSFKANVMRAFFLDIHLIARLIGSHNEQEAYDVEFDETNGSHNEQENLDDVRSDGLRNAMKNMSIGDVRPREEDEDEWYEDGPSISTRVNPSTSISNDQAQQIVQDSSNDDSQVQNQVGSFISLSTSTQEPIVPQRIHHVLAKDHPVDEIMGDISKGFQTRSRIASFCEHYSFVSFLEPNHVDEALRDPDWVNAMHEELNNFARIKFGI